MTCDWCHKELAAVVYTYHSGSYFDFRWHICAWCQQKMQAQVDAANASAQLRSLRASTDTEEA